MGDGARRRAPCGHMGEVVIGTYVQCKICDKQAAPKHVPPEKTEPMHRRSCPHCYSMDIEQFMDDLDAAFWHIGAQLIPGNTPMPNAGEWGCHGCGRVFARPL